MPSLNRRAAGRRRAWGRGPIILRFEPLEGRQLLTGGGSDTTNAALPDLVAVKFDSLHNLDWDQSFHAVGSIMNEGSGATTSPVQVDVYASPETTPVSGAVKIGTITIPAGLQPGQTYQFDQVLWTPAQPLSGLGSAPSYYLTLQINPDQSVAESNYANDVQGLQGVDASMVTITPQRPSQLVAAGIRLRPGTANWGDTLHATATILNNGDGNAPPTTARIVVAPYGQDPLGPNGVTIGTLAIPQVLAHQSVTINQDLKLTSAPPASLASTNWFNVKMVVDSDHVANPVVTTSPSTPQPVNGVGLGEWTMIQILPPTNRPTAQQPRPDLKVDQIQSPSAVAWGQTFQIKTTLENAGAANAGPFKVHFLLSQSDNSSDPMLSLGTVEVPGLPSSYSQDITETVRLPGRIPAGLSTSATTGRIIVQVDPEHSVDDSNAANNTLSSVPITLNVVGTDGSTTPVVTTPAPSTPPVATPGPTTPAGGTTNSPGTATGTGTGTTTGTGAGTGTTTGTGTKPGTGSNTPHPTPAQPQIPYGPNRIAQIRQLRQEWLTAHPRPTRQASQVHLRPSAQQLQQRRLQLLAQRSAASKLRVFPARHSLLNRQGQQTG